MAREVEVGATRLFIRTEEIGWNPSAPPPLCTVRFARWASLDLLAAGQAPGFIADLSLPFRMWPAFAGYDYISLVAVGCEVYASWAEQTLDGVWAVRAAHITADIMHRQPTVDRPVAAGASRARSPLPGRDAPPHW